MQTNNQTENTLKSDMKPWSMTQGDYEIVEVKTGKDLKKFINLPDKIYPEDSRYVMPLEAHIKMMMGKLGAPKKHFFLALKNGSPVARMGFKVHEHGGK